METREEIKQRYNAYRKELYRDHSQAEELVKKRGRWLLVLLIYSLVLTLIKVISLAVANGTELWVMVLGFVVGFGMNVIILAAAMGSKWKMAFILYGWVLYNLYRVAGALSELGIASPAEFLDAYRAVFQRQPLIGLADALSWLFIALVLGVAIWLTVPARSRRLGQEAEALEEQWKQYVLTAHSDG